MMASMIISINGNAVTGIDVARYQGRPNLSLASSNDETFNAFHNRPSWLNLLGIKCWDSKYGEDTQFRNNRSFAAGLGVRWRFLYIYLRDPNQFGDISHQMASFLQAVETLAPHEALMLDWEDKAVNRSHIDEATRILRVMTPDRWAVYVNDMTPDMTEWMKENRDAPPTEKVPVVHPSWQTEGWVDADFWDACVWQVFVAPIDAHPDLQRLYPQASAIDVDWVRKPAECDALCGLSQQSGLASNANGG